MQNLTRNKSMNFRVTQEEYNQIIAKQKLSGIRNLRHFMLKMILEGRVIHVEMESIKECCRLLSGYSNNVNQIAKRCNQGADLYGTDLTDIKHRQDEIWEQQRKILRLLGNVK